MRGYVAAVVGSMLTIVTIAASVNLAVDPNQVYASGVGEAEATAAEVLADGGAILDRGQQRYLKLAMAESVEDGSCVAIGSSRVLQLRSDAVAEVCVDRFVNLGVSGGAFEDVVYMAHAAQQAGAGHFIIAVDPWMLKWAQDVRWEEHADRMAGACDAFGLVCADLPASVDHGDLARNLINGQYLAASLDRLRFGVQEEIEVLASIPSDELRYEQAAVVADGSVVYGTDVSSEPITGVARIGYKLDPPSFDPSAVQAWRILLDALTEHGEVTLLLSPFHPDAFEYGELTTSLSIVRDAEAQIRLLAVSLGIEVLGAYDPSAVGCTKADFYDEQHSNAECMRRLMRGSQ